MDSIEFLRQQLRLQQRKLAATNQAIQQLSELLEEERDYTRQLTEKSQPKPQVEVTPKEPTLSKADQVAQLTDNQLLAIMGNPKKTAQLFKGL
jgi:hypothetical protein